MFWRCSICNQRMLSSNTYHDCITSEGIFQPFSNAESIITSPQQTEDVGPHCPRCLLPWQSQEEHNCTPPLTPVQPGATGSFQPPTPTDDRFEHEERLLAALEEGALAPAPEPASASVPVPTLALAEAPAEAAVPAFDEGFPDLFFTSSFFNPPELQPLEEPRLQQGVSIQELEEAVQNMVYSQEDIDYHPGILTGGPVQLAGTAAASAFPSEGRGTEDQNREEEEEAEGPEGVLDLAPLLTVVPSQNLQCFLCGYIFIARSGHWCPLEIAPNLDESGGFVTYPSYYPPYPTDEEDWTFENSGMHE